MNNGQKQPPPQQPSRAVEIIHTPSPQEPTDIDVLAVIERRNEMMTRILDYAIRATHPGQWCDLGGKPWPTAAACEVMARRCAVSIKNVQTNKVPSTDDKGPFYMYVVTATAQLPGGYDSLEAMGTCSSRDSFLGTETREGRPLSEIHEDDILKAAYSNMIVNAVTRLLGVRALSWDRLTQGGIEQSKTAKVDYQSGAKGGGNSADVALEPLKFGKSKGKKLSELQDSDLRWYADVFRKDIADPEKSKWKTRAEKMLAGAEAELAKRSNGPTQSDPWTQIYRACQAAGIKDIAAYSKKITGKEHSSKLTTDDVGMVTEALKGEARP